MESRILTVIATVLLYLLSGAAVADTCYVIGNTSENDLSKPPGSMGNPYGSLAAIQADNTCDTLIVLFSETALNGGITLRNGQELIGQPGPAGSLPVISNTSALVNDGHGIRLAAKNSISFIHVRDTFNRGISGIDTSSLSVANTLITEFGNSGQLLPNPQGTLFAPPGIFVQSSDDVRITVENSELGDGVSNGIYFWLSGGLAKITVENVTVRDGRDVGQQFSQAVGVFTFADASVDLKLIDVHAMNVSQGLTEGTSGIAVFGADSSSMTMLVDGFNFLNPDFDAFEGGLTIGAITGSASISGEVKNSVIRNATGDGINLLGIFGFGHSIDAHISNNEIYDSGTGILLRDLFSGFSTYNVNIEKNQLVNTGIGVFNDQVFPFFNSLNLFLEKNSIENSFIGFLNVARVFDDSSIFNVDAGGGALGSKGRNRFVNTFLDAIADGPVYVFAQSNWWGDPNGPDIVLEFFGGVVDYVPFLTKDFQED